MCSRLSKVFHNLKKVLTDFVNFSPVLYFDIEIDIHATEDIPSVNVLMVSKGIIVLSEKVKMENRKGQLIFNPRFESAPTSNVIAYYVNENNEIVSDSTTISLRNRLPNYVSLVSCLLKSISDHATTTLAESCDISNNMQTWRECSANSQHNDSVNCQFNGDRPKNSTFKVRK